MVFSSRQRALWVTHTLEIPNVNTNNCKNKSVEGCLRARCSAHRTAGHDARRTLSRFAIAGPAAGPYLHSSPTLAALPWRSPAKFSGDVNNRKDDFEPGFHFSSAAALEVGRRARLHQTRRGLRHPAPSHEPGFPLSCRRAAVRNAFITRTSAPVPRGPRPYVRTSHGPLTSTPPGCGSRTRLRAAAPAALRARDEPHRLQPARSLAPEVVPPSRARCDGDTQRQCPAGPARPRRGGRRAGSRPAELPGRCCSCIRLPPVPSRCASAERGRAASRSAALPGVGRAGRREKREAGKGRAATEPEPGCGPEVLSGTQALLQGSRGGVGAEVLREHRTQMGQVLFSQPAGFQSWAGSQRAQGRACCTRAPHHPAFSSLQGPLVYLSHMSVWAVYVRKSAIHKLAGR